MKLEYTQTFANPKLAKFRRMYFNWGKYRSFGNRNASKVSQSENAHHVDKVPILLKFRNIQSFESPEMSPKLGKVRIFENPETSSVSKIQKCYRARNSSKVFGNGESQHTESFGNPDIPNLQNSLTFENQKPRNLKLRRRAAQFRRF